MVKSSRRCWHDATLARGSNRTERRYRTGFGRVSAGAAQTDQAEAHVNSQARFFDACRSGNLPLVDELFQQDNTLIHTIDSKGFTPLILAVYNEQPGVVDYLLQQGAHVDAQDFAGNTALMGVCFKGYKKIAAQLLSAGADVNITNANNATALTFAAKIRGVNPLLSIV